jgi:probable HAF family extracellular repeat protein
MKTLESLFLCLVALATSIPSHALAYRISDLGVLADSANYTKLHVRQANSHGQVIGYSALSGGYAFLYTPGAGFADLGVGQSGDPLDINDSGQVVGAMAVPGGNGQAFLYTPGSGLTNLGAMGDRSLATGVNNLGQIVGWYGVDYADYPYRSFLYTVEQGMTDLSVPDANTYAGAINDAGQVAGYFEGSDANDHIFLYRPSLGTVDLGTLGVGDLWVTAMSEEGYVTGVADYAGDRHDGRAFVYRPGAGITELGVSSLTYGVNDLGQVVGSLSGNAHAFVYTPGLGITDLGTLGGWSSTAYWIGNSGRIIGIADDADRNLHVVAWDPVPEPSSLAALGLGLLPLAGTLRRRRK